MNETVASTRVSRTSFESQGISGTKYAAVTNGVDYVNEFKGFIVGAAGNVNIVGEDGVSCVLPNLSAGFAHPFFGKAILATSTTATGIIAIS